MNREKKLLSNTALLAVGTFGSKLLVFLLMPLYTAWLTTAEYGTAELISGIANFLIPVACLGVSTGVFRFAASGESDREAVFSGSMALLFLGLGGFLLLSPLLLLFEYCRGYVLLIVAYVFFADLQAVCAQYLRAIDRTSLFAGQGILNTALTVGFNILFLRVFSMGAEGYILSVILGNLVTTVFLTAYAKLWRAFHLSKVRRRMVWELFCFSLPMVPTTVCWLITDLSDRAMVTWFCGESVNGIYSAAYKIPTIVNLVSGIFLQAWQFSAVAESSDEAECGRFYSRVYSGFLSLVMLGAGGLILLSPFLSGLLLNRAYASAAAFMPTLLCAAALEAIVSFLASVYLVRKKSMHSFVTALSGALFNIGMNLLLIPRMGALGAAVATLGSYALVLILRLWDAPRIIRFSTHLPRLTLGAVLLLALSAVMTVEALPLRYLWAILLLALSLALHLPALLRGVKALIRQRM